MTSIYQKVYQTSDLGQFKFETSNRPIYPKHVEHLVDSIKRDNRLHLKPIVVNKELIILDGQHRLKACEKLGIAIWYVINENPHQDCIIDDQIQQKWKPKDYLHHFTKREFPEYVKCTQFMYKHDIDFQQIYVCYETSKGESANRFKKGEFIFNDNMEKFLLSFSEAQRIIMGMFNNKSAIRLLLIRKDFVKAMFRFYNEQKNGFDKLINVLPNYISDISENTPKASISAYFNILKGIHNKHKGKGGGIKK